MRRGISTHKEDLFDLEIDKSLRRMEKELRNMARNRNDPGPNDNLNGLGFNENPIIGDANPPIVHGIDDRDRPIREHVVLMLDDLNSGIVRPTIQAQQFELKPIMF
ncbi:hypothetical protein PVK06_039555 [Gossypium arboreum]|uniref:Uncharacterized protein n=1 Tax=Gossypium arboreum TaxID=29729 RepID=A0ABR0N371_GOSAR|nr:hypothetical protein PVK06_039555 [Gossypium arboreum]